MAHVETAELSRRTVEFESHREMLVAKGLAPITPHECRHTFASLMIAAGVNLKALQVFMGHSTITTTLDRYGHLLPGSEDEAGEPLDAYLTAATGEATLGKIWESRTRG